MTALVHMLPADVSDAVLAGRLLLDDGPTPVVIRGGAVEDVSRSAATIADLMDLPNPSAVRGDRLFGVEELERVPAEQILAPVDLQAIEAASGARRGAGGEEPRREARRDARQRR